MATGAVATAAASAAPPEKPKKLRLLLLKIGGFLDRRLLTICWVTYVFGLVWVLLHPAVTVSTAILELIADSVAIAVTVSLGEMKPRGTYISENALLIDSFDPRNSHQETQMARDFQRSLVDIPALPSSGCNESCAQVVDWIDAQLRTMDRVESYRHSFVDTSKSSSNPVTRTNIYGILRASPLADGKESVVLVTHYRNVGAANGEYSGVALGLALLQYLVDAKWLAKDIVLLFADDGPLDGSDGFAPGTEAWLQAYHLDPLQLGQQQQQQNELPMRAGVIRAAVNLETFVPVSEANVMGVFTAGINGQLPNLDLVNTAVVALRGEHISVALDRCSGVDPFSQQQQSSCANDVLSKAHLWLKHAIEEYVPIEHKQQAREYLQNLKGMLRFMKTLATGPAGAHAHFISYNIDSITLSALASQDPASHPSALSLRATLRSLEKIVRALSNLEEKLHQSFFLYVLPNTQHFVSVGEYYYVVALAVSPAIAHMTMLAAKTIGMRLAFSLITILLVQVLALVVLATATTIFASSSPRMSSTSASTWWGFVVATTVAQALFVTGVLPFLRSITVISGCAERRDWRVRVRVYEEKHKNDDKKDGEKAKAELAKQQAAVSKSEPKEDILADIPEQGSGWRGIKFLAMILVVYAHCILGIINYPMAFFCAVPMALFSLIEPLGLNNSVVKQLWCALWLLLSSPIAVFSVGYYLGQDGFFASLLYIVDSFTQRINLLALPYICCLYLPVHTLSIGIWLYPIAQDQLNDDAAAAKKKLMKKNN